MKVPTREQVNKAREEGSAILAAAKQIVGNQQDERAVIALVTAIASAAKVAPVPTKILMLAIDALSAMVAIDQLINGTGACECGNCLPAAAPKKEPN